MSQNQIQGQGLTQELSAVLDAAVALAPKVNAVVDHVGIENIGSAPVTKAIFLAAVSGRPLYLHGDFGINKTGVVEAIVGLIEGSTLYDVLMPGVVSGSDLIVESTAIEETLASNGVKTIRTRDTLGRAAAADFVFADEIWKTDPRVLNTLIDLSKGGKLRYDGQVTQTPLRAFIAASNELPDAASNLGAMWSRMTFRYEVQPLERAGLKAFAAARLRRGRGAVSTPATLTMEELDLLRKARWFVEVGEDTIDTVLDLYDQLVEDDPSGFAWLKRDNRRFGRVLDALQASAVIAGRAKVGKPDLRVLELLAWDTPAQIPVVKAKIAPLVRTPLSDAQELVNTLLAPDGTVAAAKAGDMNKLVGAIKQFQQTAAELERLAGEADATEKPSILALRQQVAEEQQATASAMLSGKTSH